MRLLVARGKAYHGRDGSRETTKKTRVYRVQRFSTPIKQVRRAGIYQVE